MSEPDERSGTGESPEQRLQRAREALEHATQLAASNAAARSQARKPAHQGAENRADEQGTADQGAVDSAAPPEEPTAGSRSGGRGRSAEQRRRRRARMPGQEPPPAGSAAVDAEPDPESVARTVALNQLNHSARSRAQIAEAMARKDVPPEVAEKVLDRFEEVGLVDDAEYAAMLVRTRQAERGLARRALAVELKRKGIDPETASRALEAVDPEDEEESARRVVDKRLRSMRTLEPEVKKRRLAAMLARKGHPAGLSYRVIDEALKAEGDGA